MNDSGPAGPTGAHLAWHRRSRHWLLMATVMLGTMSVAIETTIVNVALQTIMEEFGSGPALTQWLSAGFLAAMTVTMLAVGGCISAFGLKRTYLVALSVFMAASFAGYFATSMGMLIAARIAQGAMAGVVQPFAMIVIFQAFAAHQRSRAIALYGFGVILGPAVAPALGGLIMELGSWRLVFVVSVPIVVAAVAMAAVLLEDDADHDSGAPFDLTGFAIMAAAVAATLIAISGLAGRPAWQVLTAAGFAVLAWGIFARHVLVTTAPIFDIRVFTTARFAVGVALSASLGALLYGSTFVVPLYVEQVLDGSAAQAGLVLLPGGLVMAASFLFTGLVQDRMSPRHLVAAGLVLVGVSCGALAASPLAGTLTAVAVLVAVGRIGIGLMFPPINTASLAALPGPRIAFGSGGVNFSRQLGGALGVNMVALVLDRAAGGGAPGAFSVSFALLAALCAAAVVGLALWGRPFR